MGTSIGSPIVPRGVSLPNNRCQKCKVLSILCEHGQPKAPPRSSKCRPRKYMSKIIIAISVNWHISLHGGYSEKDSSRYPCSKFTRGGVVTNENCRVNSVKKCDESVIFFRVAFIWLRHLPGKQAGTFGISTGGELCGDHVQLPEIKFYSSFSDCF